MGLKGIFDSCARIIAGILGSGKNYGICWNNWIISLNNWCNILTFECRVVQSCVDTTMKQCKHYNNWNHQVTLIEVISCRAVIYPDKHKEKFVILQSIGII